MSTPTRPSPPMRVKAMGHLVRKADSAQVGKPVFRITAATLDRHCDRMLPTALNVEAYATNPVVLWNHDDSQPAIGTARVYQEGEEWLAEVSFSEVTQVARDVAALVAEGTLRTCSIGFIIEDLEHNDEGGWNFTSVELCELSITNVPAVREAQRVKTDKQTKGSDTTPPAEKETGKALEQADVDTIKAALAEAMKPCMEAIAALSAKLDALGGAKAADEAPAEETPPEEEKAEDEPPPEETPPEEKKSAAPERRGFFFVS